MKVFLSYAYGEADAPIAARLRAVAAAYEISILLPDRSQLFFNPLPTDTLNKIRQADAVIALLTRSAPDWSKQVISTELQVAAQTGKPIVPLVEQGIPIIGVPDSQIVYFNRFDPTAHEASLINVLRQIQEQQRKKDLTALGWIAGIALGLVALSELLNDKK